MTNEPAALGSRVVDARRGDWLRGSGRWPWLAAAFLLCTVFGMVSGAAAGTPGLDRAHEQPILPARSTAAGELDPALRDGRSRSADARPRARARPRGGARDPGRRRCASSSRPDSTAAVEAAIEAGGGEVEHVYGSLVQALVPPDRLEPLAGSRRCPADRAAVTVRAGRRVRRGHRVPRRRSRACGGLRRRRRLDRDLRLELRRVPRSPGVRRPPGGRADARVLRDRPDRGHGSRHGRRRDRARGRACGGAPSRLHQQHRRARTRDGLRDRTRHRRDQHVRRLLQQRRRCRYRHGGVRRAAGRDRQEGPRHAASSGSTRRATTRSTTGRARSPIRTRTACSTSLQATRATRSSSAAGRTTCVYARWRAWAPTGFSDFDLYVTSAPARSWRPARRISRASTPTEEACFTNNGPTQPFSAALVHRAGDESPLIDLFVPGGADLEHVEPRGSLLEPAASSSVLSVGAVCVHNGAVQPYSARGRDTGPPKPDLVAPDAVSNTTAGLSGGLLVGLHRHVGGGASRRGVDRSAAGAVPRQLGGAARGARARLGARRRRSGPRPRHRLRGRAPGHRGSRGRRVDGVPARGRRRARQRARDVLGRRARCTGSTARRSSTAARQARCRSRAPRPASTSATCSSSSRPGPTTRASSPRTPTARHSALTRPSSRPQGRRRWRRCLRRRCPRSARRWRRRPPRTARRRRVGFELGTTTAYGISVPGGAIGLGRGVTVQASAAGAQACRRPITSGRSPRTRSARSSPAGTSSSRRRPTSPSSPVPSRSAGARRRRHAHRRRRRVVDAVAAVGAADPDVPMAPVPRRRRLLRAGQGRRRLDLRRARRGCRQDPARDRYRHASRGGARARRARRRRLSAAPAPPRAGWRGRRWRRGGGSGGSGGAPDVEVTLDRLEHDARAEPGRRGAGRRSSTRTPSSARPVSRRR